VLLPTIVNLDGFILSHVVEAMEFPEQEVVDKFLPPYHPRFSLDPRNPVTMGAFAMPEVYTEVKMGHQMALTGSYEHILNVWKEWADLTGRIYKPVEKYKTNGAKILLLTMGCLSEVAEVAVDEMRVAGLEVGLLKLRMWRPFPFADLRAAVEGAELLIVCDRALSLGGAAPPVLAEVRSAFYEMPNKPRTASFVIGLGGRDVDPGVFKKIVAQAQAEAETGPTQEYHIFGVRG
jgi:pyruvate ferredoxin oxidoreductase alpha subunit